MRRTRYAHYTLSYYFVRCPKYRRKVLTEEAAERLRNEFPELKEAVNEESLWTRSYYVGTAGHVSSETIRRYIEECRGM